MRLGNFWGMPASQLLIVFDENYDELYKGLQLLNNTTNSFLLKDIQKEFLVLKKVAETYAIELPPFEKVSETLGIYTNVSNCIIEGQNSMMFESLLTEMTFYAIGDILKKDSRGVYFDLPADLRQAMREYLIDKKFSISEIKSVVRGFVKSLHNSSESKKNMLIEKFHLKKVAPEFTSIFNQHYPMDNDMKEIWKFYNSRLSVINECIVLCSTGVTSENLVFDVPFFDMIKRKPMSLKYKTLEIFDKANVRQTAHFVSQCKEECTEELRKYRKCISEYVIQDSETSLSSNSLTHDDCDNILSKFGSNCMDFFNNAFYNRLLIRDDLQESDLEYLANMYSFLENSDEKITSLFNSNVDIITTKAEKMGVFGIVKNIYEQELFKEALSGISLATTGHLFKSETEMEDLNKVLDDIQALIDTLLPVGEAI